MSEGMMVLVMDVNDSGMLVMMFNVMSELDDMEAWRHKYDKL